MKYLKTFEKLSNSFKVGDYIRIKRKYWKEYGWFGIEVPEEEFLSKNIIFKITEIKFDVFSESTDPQDLERIYHIENIEDTWQDEWVAAKEMTLVPEIEMDAKKYNL